MLQVTRLVLADPAMNQQLVDDTRPAEKELLDLIATQNGEGKARLHVQLVAVVDKAAQEETHERDTVRERLMPDEQHHGRAFRCLVHHLFVVQSP